MTNLPGTRLLQVRPSFSFDPSMRCDVHTSSDTRVSMLASDRLCQLCQVASNGQFQMILYKLTLAMRLLDLSSSSVNGRRAVGMERVLFACINVIFFYQI